MQRLLRVLEEDVRMVRALAVEIEEAESQFPALGRTVEGRPCERGKTQPSGALRRGRRQPGTQKSARQPLDDRFEQGVQVGFGIEAAAEFNQGLAIVVLLPVEGLVDPTLNAALERIEDSGRDENGTSQRPIRGPLQACRCGPVRAISAIMPK